MRIINPWSFLDYLKDMSRLLNLELFSEKLNDLLGDESFNKVMTIAQGGTLVGIVIPISGPAFLPKSLALLPVSMTTWKTKIGGISVFFMETENRDQPPIMGIKGLAQQDSEPLPLTNSGRAFVKFYS